ncbi:MAG: glycosyltransferase [Akkermansia sp.]
MHHLSTPKVSVLIPIYKTNAKHLGEAIDSILSQSFRDFELLILNDSPDQTKLGDIVRAYQDNRIKYHINEKNLGIAQSRNKLIDLAQGEYLAIMDHDDISLPQRFEKQVAFLDSHPDVGVVGTYAESFPYKGHYPTRFEHDEEIKLALMTNCSIIHPSAMIRASILRNHQIRYDEKFTPAEDYALWARLLPLTNFHNIPEILFHYRWHVNSTTKKQLSKMRQASMRIHDYLRENNPELYAKFHRKAHRVIRLRLFGCIPLFKIIRGESLGQVYLFDLIPIIKIKYNIKMY